MEKYMGDLRLKEALVFIFFLDYIIIFSDTLEEHEKRLLHILRQLKDYGLKLSPEKCPFPLPPSLPDICEIPQTCSI